jgi:hypothetical protein
MESGEISGNFTKGTSFDGGGGVYVCRGSFVMEAGKISGNATYGDGGGVYVFAEKSSFEMSGGEITGNSANGDGGGVEVRGSFAMKGGEISGNSAHRGGGVEIANYMINNVLNVASFSKTGGVIYGSSADDSLKNTAGSGDTWGHAVLYNNGDTGGDHHYYRDTTLNAGDNISTDDLTNNWGEE